MKEGCQGVSVAMPRENVRRLDQLRSGNRTHHVNKAVQTYLDIQGATTNRYGVDCDYLKVKMERIMRDMDNMTAEELTCVFGELRNTAKLMGAGINASA